ncbi:ABC transporter ATP-binding protein [Halorarum halobium]|uniref:ABC transporter ATP-binding protein n=1 Tax=Halorarum halobium TaxID=3075121 RepID=UPI0028B20960|nr:ATP-binding cassette domain-containing protein [Halobaculum sp. XH14]
MANVTLDGITKIYDDAKGTERAVDDISLAVDEGELLVLVGPSGCGKSTTLRLIAGLEAVSQGAIEFDESEVQTLTPSDRNVAMVFQNYALYTKMTGEQNIEYGLKHSMDIPESERKRHVHETAELLGIDDLLDDLPAEMSGGQKQRIALARAIVRDPAVFLLDEPLSNLDAKRRAQMRTEVQRIHEEIDVATIYVTHDQKEAMTMADRLAVMNDGEIEQIAPPEEAYDDPNNRFVATFLGSPAMNVLECETERRGEEVQLISSANKRPLQHLPRELVPEEYDRSHLDVGLRPEDLKLSTDTNEYPANAEVVVSEYQGKENFVYLDFDGIELTVRTGDGTDLRQGMTVSFTVAPANVYLFDPDSGTSLKTRSAVREPAIVD